MVHKTVCVVGLGIGKLYVDACKRLEWTVITVDQNATLSADYLSVDDIPFREIFGGARQDSGDPEDYILSLRLNGFDFKAMASEISSESNIYKVI